MGMASSSSLTYWDQATGGPIGMGDQSFNAIVGGPVMRPQTSDGIPGSASPSSLLYQDFERDEYPQTDTRPPARVSLPIFLVHLCSSVPLSLTCDTGPARLLRRPKLFPSPRADARDDRNAHPLGFHLPSKPYPTSLLVLRGQSHLPLRLDLPSPAAHLRPSSQSQLTSVLQRRPPFLIDLLLDVVHAVASVLPGHRRLLLDDATRSALDSALARHVIALFIQPCCSSRKRRSPSASSPPAPRAPHLPSIRADQSPRPSIQEHQHLARYGTREEAQTQGEL